MISVGLELPIVSSLSHLDYIHKCMDKLALLINLSTYRCAHCIALRGKAGRREQGSRIIDFNQPNRTARRSIQRFKGGVQGWDEVTSFQLGFKVQGWGTYPRCIDNCA